MKFVAWDEEHTHSYNSEPDKLEGELASILTKAKEEKIMADALEATKAAERAIKMAELAKLAEQRKAEEAEWEEIIDYFVFHGLPTDQIGAAINGMKKAGFKKDQIVEVLNAMGKDRAAREYKAKQAEKEAVPKPASYGLWA